MDRIGERRYKLSTMRIGETAVLISVFLLSGCTIQKSMIVAPANIGPKETQTQIVEGESSSFYFLFLGPFGDSSLNAAVQDATDKSNSHSLLNVFVDRSYFSVLVFSRITTHIRGTAIRYDGIKEFGEVSKEKLERIIKRFGQEDKSIDVNEKEIKTEPETTSERKSNQPYDWMKGL